MDDIFLAKISVNNTKVLIFTDGRKYSCVNEYYHDILSFSDFLKLETTIYKNLLLTLKNKLPNETKFLSLIEDNQIFATGCTFEWSLDKFNSTSDDDVYKKVYLSDRSMFFYKGNELNTASNFENIGLRQDSSLTIPEAEIVLVFNHEGKIIGHTIGNDVTAVDLEKLNPLFQAQAKFYKGSVSILPLIKLGDALPMTNINCKVIRDNNCISETTYSTKTFMRSTSEIVKQLVKLGLTPNGGFLFIGCGVSYPKDKGLIPNDTVIIQSDFLPIQLQNNCDYV